MSPSTSRFGVPLGTEDFDVGGRGRRGSGDQGSVWPGAEEVVEDERREEANMETFQEGGGGPDGDTAPSDAAESASLLPRNRLLTHGGQGMQTVASSHTVTVGGHGGAVRGCGGGCVGRVGSVRASVYLQMKCSAAAPQEHPAPQHGKARITLGSAAPSGTAQDGSESHVFRTKQDRRTSSTNALFWTRHPERDASNPTADAPCKEHVSKNLSHVAANPLFGATPLGGRSSHPAGNLTSAAAGVKAPPRPWEPRVLLLALLLAASANGKSSGTRIELQVLLRLVL